MASKIRIIIRSFEKPFLKSTDCEGFSRIRLPETRVVYTVNRSPHVDKKSREQFEMRVKTYVLDAKPEVQDLRKKLFWLKRQRIFGAQYEVRLSTKTRLDMSKLQAKT